MRAVLPAEGLPEGADQAPRDGEGGSLDDKLARVEESTGEKVHHLVASIDGALGGEVTVSISVVTAADGPATPPEDIWSEAVPMTTLACGSSEVAAARLHWVNRVSAARGLLPPEITRRYRVGTSGFRGEPGAVGMLLDARLHMARHALEQGEEEVRERAIGLEDAGAKLRVVADFTSKGTIELFSDPEPSPELRAAVEAWLAAHR